MKPPNPQWIVNVLKVIMSHTNKDVECKLITPTMTSFWYVFKKTRLKTLPVISREHFRKTRVPTTFINTYLVSQIPICKMESQILALLKGNWYFKFQPIGTSTTNLYFQYPEFHQEQQQQQQSEYKSPEPR
jgi:hypothetical protein